MRVTAVIDRFEGTKAVLLVGEEEIMVNWPRKLLPETAKEGDHLQLVLAVDEQATAAAKAEAQALLKSLTENSGR